LPLLALPLQDPTAGFGAASSPGSAAKARLALLARAPGVRLGVCLIERLELISVRVWWAESWPVRRSGTRLQGLGKLGGAMPPGLKEVGWRWGLPQRGEQELAGEQRLRDAGMLARAAASAPGCENPLLGWSPKQSLKGKCLLCSKACPLLFS